MNFDRVENETRRMELIRELEALYYDLVAKDYIRE